MMMGFRLNKILLLFINVFYLAISIAMISIAAYAWWTAKLASSHLALGIVFVGVALLLLSFLGILSALTHNQAMLFFYVAFMLLIYIVQYSLAISSLALAHRDMAKLIRKTWNSNFLNERQDLKHGLLADVMTTFQCCGLDKRDYRENINDCKNISLDPLTQEPVQSLLTEFSHNRGQCGYLIETRIDGIMTHVGTVALVFCFFEMFGVWLAMRFRNMKNPFLEALTSTHRTSIPIRRRSDH